MRKLVIGVLAVFAVATSCSKAEAKASMLVGALYPISGPLAPAGREELRGVQLAVERVNKQGGVNHQQLKLITADAPTPESADIALRSLAKRNVQVVFGSQSSAISAATALASRRQNVTFFETGAVGTVDSADAGGKSFFRLAPMGANLGRAAVSFVGDQLLPGQPLKWAVAHVNDAYGTSVADGAVAEIQRRGLPVVGVFAYDGHNMDAPAIAQQIAKSGANALFVSSYVDDGVALRRADLAAGNKMLAEIGTSSSYCHPAFGAALGADAVGLFASDKPDAGHIKADALSPEGRAALQWVGPLYKSRFHDDMSAPALSGFSGALGVLAHVLPMAKVATADAVRAVVGSVHLADGTLPNGSGLEFAPAGAPDAGDNRLATSVIWEWVAPQTRAVVWPAAFATSPIVR